MRKLLLLFTLVAILSGDILDEKIKTLVDTKSYLRHQKLIDVIFRDRDKYFNGENIDYIKVVETLKNNGLLKIFYSKPKDLVIEFETAIAPKIFIKSITDVLREMGYNLYVTSLVKRNELSLKWSINYTSDHVVDPLLFGKKLQNYNMVIHEITRDKNVWKYDIGSVGVSLADAKKVDEYRLDYSLLDPDGEYWIEINAVPYKIRFKRVSTGYWYPKVVFYDKNLKILKIYENDNSRRKITLTMPIETKFVKATDKYSAEGLKRGIVVELLEPKEEQK